MLEEQVQPDDIGSADELISWSNLSRAGNDSSSIRLVESKHDQEFEAFLERRRKPIVRLAARLLYREPGYSYQDILGELSRTLGSHTYDARNLSDLACRMRKAGVNVPKKKGGSTGIRS